jgi:hypothetical protein
VVALWAKSEKNVDESMNPLSMRRAIRMIWLVAQMSSREKKVPFSCKSGWSLGMTMIVHVI